MNFFVYFLSLFLIVYADVDNSLRELSILNQTTVYFTTESTNETTEPVPPAIINGTNVAPEQSPNLTPVWVPREFPHGKVYNGTRIIEGDLKDLEKRINASRSTEKGHTGIELADLLRNDDRKNVSVVPDSQTPPAPVTFGDQINDETELIEDGENTEEERRIMKSNLEEIQVFQEVDPMEQGWVLVVIVGVLVIGSVVTYLALLSWRRFLEQKYGSRQVLVNEEDFEDPNDLRHFTI